MADSDGQVVIDLSLRRDGIQSDIEWLKSNFKNLGADVDADQISEKFEDAMNKTKHTVNEAIESIDNKKAKPKISADDSSLKEKTSESSEKIEKLNGKHAKAKISADNTNLDEKVSESKEELNKIPKNKKTTITVDDEASGPTKKIGSSFKESTKKSKGFTESLKGTAVGMGVYQAAMAAGHTVTEHLGDAINRVDTLNNSKRVFQNMGYSAKDTKKTMDDLNKSINGLPTPLDKAVQGVQMVAATTNNLGQAQKVWSALNDAVIGFGGTTDQVNEATIQLSQAFSNGKIDGQTWISMMNAGMGPALNAIAKQMGKTTGQLKDGLSDGSISVKEFQDKLIELDAKGGGGLKSLHQIAKDSTSGIKTSIANAGTAITRGLGNVVVSFSNMLKTITGQNLSEIIQNMGKKTESALTGMSKAFATAGEKIKPFVDKIKPLAQYLQPLAPMIKTFAGALTGLTVATAVANGLAKVVGALGSFANPVVLAVSAISALVVGFTQLYKHNAKFKSFVDGIVKNIRVLIKNITKVAQKITKDFVGAFNKLAAPVKKAFGDIMKYIQPDLKNLQKIISSTMKNIQKVWNTAWKGLQKVVTPILNTISKFVNQHMTQIKNIINSMTKIVSTIWNTTWKQVENVFKLVWDMIFHKSRVADDVKRIVTTAAKATETIWKSVWNAIKNVFDIVWDGIKSIARSAVNWVRNVIESTIRAIQNTWNKIWSAIKDFVDNIWDGIEKIVNNAINAVHDTISNILGKIGDVWHSMWSSFSDFFKSIWKGIKEAAADGINGVLSVINAGIDGIDDVWKFFTGHETSIHHLKPVHFAQGGIVDRHLSMVNDGDGEDWKELIETPDGDLMMSDKRNAILPLEPGTRVYNGAETRQIMSMLGVDHYANGGIVGGVKHYKDGGVVGDLIDWGAHELKDFGSWIKDKWDAITKFLKHPLENTKAIISKAITGPLSKLSNSNMVALGKGVFDKLTKPISDWFKKGLEEAKKKHDEESVGGFGNIKDMKNSDDLKKLVKAALEANGLSTSDDMIARVMRQIATESGGNAHAVQPGADPDGDGSGPALGLMQTKRGTFNQYKAPGHDDIFNAYDNLLAALNYAKHTYGPSLSFLGNGHGYDNGGVVDEKQLAWIAENNREFVINPQRMTADILLKQAAEERLAYDPNSEIAKAITGMNNARANNGVVVPNTVVSGSIAHASSDSSKAGNDNGVGSIIVDLDGKTIAQASYQYTKVLQGQDVRLQTRKGGVVFG